MCRLKSLSLGWATINVLADEVESSSCFIGDGVDMVMPSQVTWYGYTKAWVRLYNGQLLSTEHVDYSWSVTFTWDAQNVTLLCIENHLPGERPVIESGNILLEWCTINGRPDLLVEDAVVSKQTNLRRNIVRDVINGNCPDKLHHPRSVAYSAQQVLLNKQQIWGGGACLHCYLINI